MLRVTVNGTEFPVDSRNFSLLGDLVEFVRSNIDPDTMITDMALDGRTLSDGDWRMPLSVHGGATLAIATGTQDDYLADRFANSAEVVDHIREEFAVARSCYEQGKNSDAGSAMKTAVTDLQAFLTWYGTLLNMAPGEWTEQVMIFKQQVDGIAKTCEQLLQQQLYNSWWAIGETVRTDLEPQLMNMKVACGSFASAWQEKSPL